jgi:hypothetical protein
MSDSAPNHARSVAEKARTLCATAERVGADAVVLDFEPAPVALAPLSGGATEVFGSIRSIGANLLRFNRPDVIASRERLEARPRRDGDPFADAAVFGVLRFALPEYIEYAQWEDVIHMDLLDGSVFYCDSDDYVFYYENPGETPEFERLAASVAEFFDEFVLGSRYPDLVSLAVGEERRLVLDTPAAVPDHWLELLREAGIV